MGEALSVVDAKDEPVVVRDVVASLEDPLAVSLTNAAIHQKKCLYKKLKED